MKTVSRRIFGITVGLFIAASVFGQHITQDEIKNKFVGDFTSTTAQIVVVQGNMNYAFNDVETKMKVTPQGQVHITATIQGRPVFFRGMCSFPKPSYESTVDGHRDADKPYAIIWSNPQTKMGQLWAYRVGSLDVEIRTPNLRLKGRFSKMK